MSKAPNGSQTALVACAVILAVIIVGGIVIAVGLQSFFCGLNYGGCH